MEIATSTDTETPALCLECQEAGCEPYRPWDIDYLRLPCYMRECQREDAYSG
jgi:hypothetical protein